MVEKIEADVSIPEVGVEPWSSTPELQNSYLLIHTERINSSMSQSFEDLKVAINISYPESLCFSRINNDH